MSDDLRVTFTAKEMFAEILGQLKEINVRLGQKADHADLEKLEGRVEILQRRADGQDLLAKQKTNTLTSREKLFGMAAVAIGLFLQAVLIVHPF